MASASDKRKPAAQTPPGSHTASRGTTGRGTTGRGTAAPGMPGHGAAFRALPVYLLYGSRTFAMEFVDSLRKAYVSPEWSDLNFSVLDGKECSQGSAISLARSVPVGPGKRLVLVTDPPWLREGAKSARPVMEYIKQPSDSSILVFYQEDRPSKSPLVDAIEKAGGLVDCSNRRGAAAELARTRAKAAGKSISPEAVWAVCSVCGDNADFVATEMDKVVAFAGDEPSIEIHHVTSVGFGHSEASVFDLADAAIAGDVDRAIMLGASLLMRNEEPQRIFQTLAWQFRNVYRLRFLRERGATDDEAARAAGLKPFVARRLLPQSKRLTKKKIASCLEAILETDVSIKLGLLDESIALETLLVRIGRSVGAIPETRR